MTRGGSTGKYSLRIKEFRGAKTIFHCIYIPSQVIIQQLLIQSQIVFARSKNKLEVGAITDKLVLNSPEEENMQGLDA